jgi:prolyl oligopeptidase
MYPPTPSIPHTDNYHGTTVSDPYRWLEDTDSPETQAWIEAQNRVTFDYLARIPARDRIRARMTELWNFPKRWSPRKRGGRYFQLRNSGLQNQHVLYVMDSPSDEGRVLLDPNTLSSDGTVAVTQWVPSDDGRRLAYSTSASGSDWQIWHVRDVDTGVDLPDVIEWSKFSGVSWLPDGSGFFYSRYDAPEAGQTYLGANYYQQLHFHPIGQPQTLDERVYERRDEKEWGFDSHVTDDGRYLIVPVWQGTDVRNRLFYIDLKDGGAMVELISELEADYSFIDNVGPVFYCRTDLNAPRGRLIAIDTTDPDKSGWRTIIPEAEDVLVGVKVVHHELIAVYLHDAHHVIKRFDYNGNFLDKIELPTLGAIVDLGNGLSLEGGHDDDELFYTFNSFVIPPTVYRYDFTRGVSEVLYAPPLPFDASPYETRQVFVTSKDGTRIPMFLVHRRGLELNGQNPTLLYGYGGFNISLPPVFNVTRAAWLELGGVYAMANLRGGGEYGEAWHKAGSLHNKQNVFDDFIACAEYLIAEKITSTPKLAIEGRSNGGLLVGACITQRPDLYGAALPAVGVMDMLRFHKFTIGWAWVSDYGSADDPEGFKTLYAYSPLHNLKPGTHYPATLVTTADHDDRVVPGHSFKFTAALQAAQAGSAPTLIRIQTKAGHGFGKPTAVVIEEFSDMWAFLVQALRM